VANSDGYNSYELVARKLIMKSVNIAELKNRLSVYLNRVKSGEEIVVRDRDLAVARIVPLRTVDDGDAQLATLAAQGLIHLGEGPLDDVFWALPAPRVSATALKLAVGAERDEA
jgi:prevent-host-death family protein